MAGGDAPLALVHARVVTPEEEIDDATVVIQGGLIAQVGSGAPPAGIESRDLRGLTVAPGFIDLHVHGGGGFSLSGDSPDDLRSYARWAPSTGVTSFLATPMAPDREGLVRRLRALAPLIEERPEGAQPLGSYLEGPFLSSERAGAFPLPWLRPPAVSEFREYLDAAAGHLRLLALAPELEGADEVIAAAREAGVIVSLAHSDATYEEARRAFALGVVHVSHCFDAMRLFHHRDPGCLTAAINAPEVTVELIADGVHVHPGAMEMLLRAKGTDRVVFVTDAVPLAGLSSGVFKLYGEEVRLEDGAARRRDGVLAGSASTMDKIVANALQVLPVDLCAVVRMAALNPARVLGISDRKGRVAPGYDADLVVLAPDMEVEMTFVGGQEVYRRGE